MGRHPPARTGPGREAGERKRTSQRSDIEEATKSPRELEQITVLLWVSVSHSGKKGSWTRAIFMISPKLQIARLSR